MASHLLLATAAIISTVAAIPGYRLVNPVSISSATNTPASTVEAVAATATPSSLGGAAASYYQSNGWIPHGQNLSAHLSQWQTNGNSLLGTHHAPQLPPWLSGPMPQGRPWGSRDSHNTNYYTDPPETGMTRHYDFTVARQTIAPDGVELSGITINGQFPGPTIEANWGDWIEVVVHNNIDDEGTSLHWHGLLQTATPYMDGVPGITQCPIAPGTTFTYRFKADLYGTSWYHSHYSAQYMAGLAGPMIIHGPKNADYDIDLGPVMLSDWYHSPYFELVEQAMAPASENLPPPFSNNNLINGKMNYPCANATGLKCTPNAGVSKFKFQSGKTHRLRLINAGAEGMQKFSIDGYKLTVIAIDYVEIVPYTTDVVSLSIGQRTDILVTATGKPTDSVWMRSTLGKNAFTGGCTLTDGISPEAVAAIYYEDADTTAIPTTTSSLTEAEILVCQDADIALSVPVYPITPDPSPTTVQQFDITYQSNGTHNLFFVNNQTFRTDYNDPLLLDAKLGATSYPSHANVYDFGASRSIRMVLYNHALTGQHPWHLHGHNAYVLAIGTGVWDGTVTNPANPQRRDVITLPNAVSPTTPAYIVLQIDADNPGVWAMHCHIALHVSAGLYVNILERPADIQSSLNIPATLAQTCRDWSAWTGANVPDQIDSGL